MIKDPVWQPVLLVSFDSIKYRIASWAVQTRHRQLIAFHRWQIRLWHNFIHSIPCSSSVNCIHWKLTIHLDSTPFFLIEQHPRWYWILFTRKSAFHSHLAYWNLATFWCKISNFKELCFVNHEADWYKLHTIIVLWDSEERPHKIHPNLKGYGVKLPFDMEWSPGRQVQYQ